MSQFQQKTGHEITLFGPGLVDGHTHPVWAGDRVHEFAMKLAGASYMEVPNNIITFGSIFSDGFSEHSVVATHNLNTVVLHAQAKQDLKPCFTNNKILHIPMFITQIFEGIL